MALVPGTKLVWLINLTESPRHSLSNVKSAIGLHLTITVIVESSLHEFPSSTTNDAR